MQYFALLTIILATSANSLAQAHPDIADSSWENGYTSDICEPIYQFPYRDDVDDDELGLDRYSNRDKRRYDDYDNDQNDELLNELGSRKARPFKKSGHPRTRHHKIDVNIEGEIQSYGNKNLPAKKNGNVKERTTLYNMNTNSNRLDNRETKNIVKDIVKEGDENDSAVDDSDADGSVELAARILENDRNQDSLEDDENPKRKVKKDGTRKRLKDMSWLKQHDPMYGPPPINPDPDTYKNGLGYRRNSANANDNVNKMVIASESENQNNEKISSKVNNETSILTDSDEPEKNSSAQISNTEITPENQDSEKIEDSSLTQEVQISSTVEPIESVTTAVNSVTEISELDGSTVDADDRRTRPTKRRQKHGKSHGKKKKKRTHHKHHNSQRRTSDAEAILTEQENELSADNNGESTTSIVGTVEESSQSPVVDNSDTEEIVAEKKLDLNESILKLLVNDPGDEKSSRKVRKLKHRLDQLSVDEKETILKDLEQAAEKRTKETKPDKVVEKEDISEDDKSKGTIELLTKSSQDGPISSNDDTANVETKSESENPDETEKGTSTKIESESDTEIKKEPQDVPENSSKATTNNEPAGKEIRLNDEEMDENESSDRVKAKLNGDSGESLRKQVDEKDVVQINHNENSNIMKVNPSLRVQTKRTNNSEQARALDSEQINDDNENEEKSLMPPEEEGKVKSRRRNHGRVTKHREGLKNNQNSNVNTNVNKVIPELRRWERIRDKVADAAEKERKKKKYNFWGKRDHSELRRGAKSMRKSENSNVNNNRNVNKMDLGKHRRSMGASRNLKKQKQNERINENLDNVEEFDETDGERATSNRKSLDRTNNINSNRNSNVNTNVNSNVEKSVADREVHHHNDHKVKLNKKTVDSLLQEVNDLRQELAEKEHVPEGDRNRDNRRRLLHKRHNDLAYLEQ